MTLSRPLTTSLFALALALAALAPAHAQDWDTSPRDGDPGAVDTPSVVDSQDFRGPASVYEGETAVFYARSSAHADPNAAPAKFEVLTTDRTHGTTFTEPRAFLAGHYIVRRADQKAYQEGRPFEVKPLPPAVRRDAPLADRLAVVEVFVWDGDRSSGGHVLEDAGQRFGPAITGNRYKVTWVLAGRQATRANVGYAIDTLARLGYTIDVFSSVHGYPIELADGEWGKIDSNPGLRSVRLFYTTACYGERGAKDFLAAGVKAYVASPGLDFLNPFHMLSFFRAWRDGATSLADADKEANRSASRLLHGSLALDILAKQLGYRPTKADFQASKPAVEGDANLTFESDPAPSPARSDPIGATPAEPSPGIVGAVARANGR